MRATVIPDAVRRWVARESGATGLVGVLLGVGAFVVALDLLGGRVTSVDFSFDLWSDRDLIRATRALEEVPTHGAELSHGGGARIPGGMQYLLMAPVVALTPEPEAMWRWIAVLDLLAAVALAGVVARRAGVLAGGLAALAWAASEAQPDALWRVWNPAFLPLFLVGAWAAADAAVVGRRPWAVPVMVASLAVGAQLHLSTALLVPPLLLTVACARGALRPLPALVAAGVAVALYGPWLLAEFWYGAPQAASLAEQAEVRRALALDPAAVEWETLGLVFLRLLPRGLVGGAALHPAIAALASFPALIGLGVVVGAAWRAAPGQRALARGALGAVALVAAYYLWDTHIDLAAAGSARYVLPLLPLVAAAAGIGARALLVAARARGRVAGAFAVATILASGVAMVGAARSHHASTSYQADRIALLRGILDGIRAETGWTLRELAGRTLVLHHLGDGWSWVSRHGIDHLLAIEGDVFPGSLPPPCAALFGPTFEEMDLTPEALARWIGPDQGEVRVLARAEVMRRPLLIYEPEVGPCRTSFVDPYLMTPVEEQLLAIRGVLPVDGAAQPLDAPEGTRRFGFRLSSVDLPGEGHGFGTVAAVDVEGSPEGPVFVLHSLQLRGSRFNSGWFGHSALLEPVVVLTGPDGELRVPFGRGLVGRGGASTPLRTGPVPGLVGAWDLRFETTVVALPAPSRPIQSLDGEPRTVQLAAAVELR